MSREALMKGAGFTRDQLDRPFIGVVNGYGEISPGAANLDKVAKAVKEGVKAAGGTPVEFYVSSTCVGMAHGGDNYRWTLPWRDITAAYIEAVAEINYFDGLVMVTVCDDGVPAHLMAAARLGLPAIVIPGGTMRAAVHDGKRLDFIELLHKYGEKQVGNVSQDDGRVIQAFEQVIEACKKNDKTPGMGGFSDTALIERHIRGGMRFIVCGTDISFLMAGAKARAEVVQNVRI